MRCHVMISRPSKMLTRSVGHSSVLMNSTVAPPLTGSWTSVSGLFSDTEWLTSRRQFLLCWAAKTGETSGSPCYSGVL